MSRFPANRLLLGCSATGAVLLAVHTSSVVEILATVAINLPQYSSVAALSSALTDLESKQFVSRGAALCVTVDDSLVRSFVVTPPSGARNLYELRASAAARFAVLYGEPAEQWLLSADSQTAAPFIVCALPRQLYQGLDKLARTNGWYLGSVCPALVRVWNRRHVSVPVDGWLGVGFGQTLTLVHTHNEQVVGLRTFRLPSTPNLSELTMLFEQERLRTPVLAEASARESLLWTGGADWLPAVPTIAGLASRSLSLRAQAVPPVADLPEPCQVACQLALAAS